MIKNNILLKNNNTINKITIKIYEGNEKLDEDNMYLEEFIINIYKYKKEIIVKISMIMDKNLKLKNYWRNNLLREK